MELSDLTESERKLIEKRRKKRADGEAARNARRAEKLAKRQNEIGAAWLADGRPALSIQHLRYIVQAEDGKEQATLHVLDRKGAALFTFAVKRDKAGGSAPLAAPSTKAPAKR
jgi:hypothetical protein